MALNKVLKVNSDSELLSYIINVTPELASEIDLPVQGQSIAPIGKLIVSNDRMKNAFINTINVLGLTIISRNYWENPWENFTNNGVLNFGDSVMELAVDIADVFDYNKTADNPTSFLNTVVPNVFNYIHKLNYQKYYKTTTSDEQIAMAFNTEGELMGLIEEIIGSLYKAYQYDSYIVNKYMLCKRIVDGTMTMKQIPNYTNLTPRERVAFIKNISNLMTFMSPNYNPAGLRLATTFDNQISIINTDFESSLTTEVLATSFFRDSADMKTRSALIDGYANHDVNRLSELLGTDYEPFTSSELQGLKNVPVCIIDREFFKNYNYMLDNSSAPSEMGVTNAGLRQTSFYNPESLKNNHWLHTWKILSTSPYKQACGFTTDEVKINSITINPSESTVSAGIPVQLTATVNVSGFANKAVIWSVESAPGEVTKVTVDINGKVTIPSDYTPTNTETPNPIVIKATSVFDETVTQTATITVL